MTENKYFQKTLAHLTELRNPLLGRDPQFGKPCPSRLCYNEYTDCLWEDEIARERTGHTPSYAEAKKMKSHIS